jgi:hypothetical protein
MERPMPWMHVIIFAPIFLSIVGQVNAREQYPGQYANVQADIKKWYEDQQNGEGLQCCAESDAYDFYDSYTVREDGSVEFEADGVRQHIPAYQVLTGPNPTGHAVWWRNESGGSYCFAVGPGG